jgi:hypothetical protein
MRGAVRTVARAGQWAYAACPICNKIDEFRRVRRALTPRPFGHLDAWHSYGWRMARHWPSSMCIWVPLAGTVGILLLATTALYVMGRPLICPCGYIKIFHPGTDDREVSQHFIDAYTYSHLTRGILLYAVLYLVAWARPRVTWGLPIAAALGGIWALVESTPMIIRSYAITTVVPDYAGGSIINSIGDILATVAGFLIAALLPVAVPVLLKLVSLFLPHDNPWLD